MTEHHVPSIYIYHPTIINFMPRIILLCLSLSFVVHSGVHAQIAQIDSVLNDFHLAASEADYDRYFSHLSEESIFIGTDITERWSKSQFQAYAMPHFEAGRGWTYHPKERHIYVSEDGIVAWFDEILINEKYGEVRGTGVLFFQGTRWKIAQYHLTVPIPNDLLPTVVEMMNGAQE